VDVVPHPIFRRAGRDLRLTLPLAVHEAALGARVDVPTLGEPVRLKIPAGTPSGRTLRIAGQGVPSPPAGTGRGWRPVGGDSSGAAARARRAIEAAAARVRRTQHENVRAFLFEGE
jgi:molecular chaperone DnaJ